MAASMIEIPESKVVGQQNLEDFATKLLQAVAVPPDEARAVATALVWSDLRARFPQGVSRLPVFIQRVQRQLITTPARLGWTTVAPAAAMLDAQNAFGHIAGSAAMRKAIELAKQNGIGAVTVSHSNLYGAAAYFVSLAADERCIGFTCTNAVAKVAPYGGMRAVFGTNPLAFGCPTSSGVPILIDLSTSALAGSVARNLGETGGSLPEGVALNKNGFPTTNPADLSQGCLLPAAGPKGFGLGMMVDILCGVLSGAAMSHEVGSMYNTWDKPVNTGHFCGAIDIGKFQNVDAFLQRIDAMIEWVRAAGPDGEVRFPGEIRGEHAAMYARTGIPLPPETVKPLEKLAHELTVAAPW
ncbi:MAG: Ldh family oxidoreductase [Ignavibacteriae bacterium]|nr:Ldh family oxidoreductase [Ignavibacteriota bacterium]